MAQISGLPPLKPIVPDDPTSPKAAPQVRPRAPRSTRTPARRANAAAKSDQQVSGDVGGEDLDSWSGITSAATHKLPVELLKELDRRVAAIGVTKTATISVALNELLALDDAELEQRVDAFQERYDRARRRAKRTP